MASLPNNCKHMTEVKRSMESGRDRESDTRECLAELHERGLGLESDYAFKIGRELDETGKEIPADVYWLRFPAAGVSELPVEGKLYLPSAEKARGEVVIFSPGYSGGKVGRFERTYAQALTEQGYAFAGLRHNSTSLIDQPEPVSVVNCETRLVDATETQQKYLGPTKPNGYNHLDLAYEPATALKSLAPWFKNVLALGHSFGSSAWLLSLDKLRRENDPSLDKVRQFLSLAGYLGRDEETSIGQFHGVKMPLDALVESELSAAIEDNVAFVKETEQVKQSLRDLASNMEQAEIPEHITQVLVSSPEDPIIASPVIKIRNEAGREVVSQYDYPGHTKRTLVVEDRTQERKFHTLPGLLPQTLVRLLAIEHPGKVPHFVAVTKKQPKAE